MPEIKLKVKVQYKQLEGVLDKGDVITIIPILSTEPKLIHHAWTNWATAKKGEKIHVYCPELIAPVGNYEGYRFVSKNGNTYTDKTIRVAIGYVPIKQLFDKV